LKTCKINSKRIWPENLNLLKKFSLQLINLERKQKNLSFSSTECKLNLKKFIYSKREQRTKLNTWFKTVGLRVPLKSILLLLMNMLIWLKVWLLNISNFSQGFWNLMSHSGLKMFIKVNQLKSFIGKILVQLRRKLWFMISN
jgi:hypothetical protein